MDSYYSANFNKLNEDDKRSSKLMDSGELTRSSKHIDSGVCMGSLSSVSSILTSSSSLSSNYSSRKSSTKKNSHHLVDNKNNSSTKFTGLKDSGLLESTELYEYDYDEDEKDDDQTEFDKETDYDLIKNKNYLISNDDLFDIDEDGNTMLHYAIMEHKTQLAYHIISLFTHPDYLDIRNKKWSQTALHLACLTGQTKIVRRLIVSGATINLIDREGNSSIHYCCKNGDLNTLRQFFTPITKAETTNLTYNVTASGCSNFKKFILNDKNFEGQNCIFLAAQSGNFELIKYLVNEGAEINSQELKEGNSAMHLAVQLKSVDLIEFLKTCGAHINKLNYANKTPLHLAWNMLNKCPNSRRIKIMIHLLKEYGGEPIDYSDESSDELDDDSSSGGELSD